MNACMLSHAQLHANTHSYTYIHMHSHSCIYTHTQSCMFMCAGVHFHGRDESYSALHQTYTHTCPHIYTRAHVCSLHMYTCMHIYVARIIYMHAWAYITHMYSNSHVFTHMQACIYGHT